MGYTGAGDPPPALFSHGKFAFEGVAGLNGLLDDPPLGCVTPPPENHAPLNEPYGFCTPPRLRQWGAGAPLPHDC